MTIACVVMGASNGGLMAFRLILSRLRPELSVPVILVQHINENSKAEYLHILSSTTSLPVELARDKQQIEPGVIYLARPGYHLLFNSRTQLGLSIDAPLNHSRPSIDLLFESAAQYFGDQLLAVLLTGENHDGSYGMRKIHDQGGYTVVQNPHQAQSPAMPAHAIQSGCVDKIATLKEIALLLDQLEASDGLATLSQA